MFLCNILVCCAGVLGAAPGERDGMVVVAPRAFHGALAEFVAYRAQERSVELVDLEGVLEKSTGVDDPEKLKRWLFDAWSKRGVRYVLLVGDADVLPVRYMVLDRVTKPAFDYAFYPSDLYYADIAKRDGSFEDWNGQSAEFHGGYFGEVRGEKNKNDGINYDKIDYRPELAVGRWPVSTVEQVARVSEKTIAYDRAVASESAPGLRRALFVAVPGWVDTRERMKGWAGQLPAGWTNQKLFDGGEWGEQHVVESLEDGASLVCHAGHGQDDRWEQSLSVDSIAGLRNGGKLPVIFSAGCSTARFATLPPYEAYEDIHGVEHAGTNAGEVFDAPPPPPACYARGKFNRTGLGERLVRDNDAGAVAYIGCNTGSQPCGLTLLDGFVQTLSTQESPTLGDCWIGAVTHYYDAEHLETLAPNDDWYPASIFFQGMKFMVFGDPALRLPGAKRQ